MARIVVCYDPEGRLAIPDTGDVPPEMRFAMLDIANVSNARDLRAAVEHLTELLMGQIAEVELEAAFRRVSET